MNEFGCVLIYGPKYSGKTYLAEKNSKSQYYMQKLGKKNYALLSSGLESQILEGKHQRLIDEWQVLPEIWDNIRYYIDKTHGEKGVFILTGSTQIYNKKKIIHSSAGRIARLRLDTLAYCEIYRNNNLVKLIDLFENKKINFKSLANNEDINKIFSYLIAGGWPAQDTFSNNRFISQYMDAIYDLNINDEIDLRYDPKISKKIIKSLARLNASQLKVSTILNDIDNSINRVTLEKYLDVYKNLHITFEINSWSSNIRSKYAIRTTPKTYLSDPSIGLYSLQINSIEQCLNDLNTIGIYFENLVIKDLSIFCRLYGAEMFFYRD